jgi:hypothetical protein
MSILNLKLATVNRSVDSSTTTTKPVRLATLLGTRDGTSRGLRVKSIEITDGTIHILSAGCAPDDSNASPKYLV